MAGWLSQFGSAERTFYSANYWLHQQEKNWEMRKVESAHQEFLSHQNRLHRRILSLFRKLECDESALHKPPPDVYQAEAAYHALQQLERQALEDGRDELAVQIRECLAELEFDAVCSASLLAAKHGVAGPAPLPELKQLEWRSNYRQIREAGQGPKAHDVPGLSADVQTSKARIYARIHNAFCSYKGGKSDLPACPLGDSRAEWYYNGLLRIAGNSTELEALSIVRRLSIIEEVTKGELRWLAEKHGGIVMPAGQPHRQQTADGFAVGLAVTLPPPQRLAEFRGLSVCESSQPILLRHNPAAELPA